MDKLPGTVNLRDRNRSRDRDRRPRHHQQALPLDKQEKPEIDRDQFCVPWKILQKLDKSFFFFYLLFLPTQTKVYDRFRESVNLIGTVVSKKYHTYNYKMIFFVYYSFFRLK